LATAPYVETFPRGIFRMAARIRAAGGKGFFRIFGGKQAPLCKQVCISAGLYRHRPVPAQVYQRRFVSAQVCIRARIHACRKD
jgi:hypothetical protein